MPKSIRSSFVALAALVSFHPALTGQQSPSASRFRPIPPIAFDTTGPVIRAHTEALKPFTVAGERGVLLGQQDGAFEAWVLPVKILSHLTIEAQVDGYSVPIDVNQQSAEIEVHPDRTVITYAHIAFTVRQIMFSPESGPPGTGPVVLFEFDCLHPTDFTLRFTPNLEFMWPMRNEGHPGPEWVPGFADGKETPGGENGFYVLHADYPDLAAALTIPGARPGILAPYQERPQVHPVEFRLHIDPARDRGRLYPLLMAIGTNPAQADGRALGATLEKLNENLAALYQAHAESYKKLLANSVSINTPDKSLNEAFQWAVVSIEQLKAKPWAPDNAKRVGDPETALVAGYYASGDSARPGFGWFFGRDSLYTLYAVNGYGDFPLARSELEFLIHRQRADGKIMHEYSQTAPAIDWQQFPYMYAAADSTPLFLLATLDYVRSSGDTTFLTANRDAIEKAWTFETSHAPDAAHGGNGIYTNEQGTGWVESWPGGMPHQEVYLALLDQQASAAMAQMAGLLGDKKLSLDAQSRAGSVARTINDQFYDKDKGCYAFSRNPDGSLDRTTTVYPALAWWSALPGTAQPNGSNSILQHPGGCLQQLAAHTLNTDWGLRDVSSEEKIYDGMSYHQGSVWPLFTGWAALAEYRANQPLAGYQMLMENANLTTAQDLGAVTELLSGDFNVPFGRSTSHQLWSSAMVITPILRGLFGIDIDATTRTITVNPHLPASWTRASVKNIPVPGGTVSLAFSSADGQLDIRLISSGTESWRLKSGQVREAPEATASTRISKTMRMTSEGAVRFSLPAIEIDQTLSSLDTAIAADNVVTNLPNQPPPPGARTSRLRVLRSAYEGRKLTLDVEGLAGSEGIVSVIRRGKFIPKLQDQSAESPGAVNAKLLIPDEDPSGPIPLVLHFPPGEGWKTITVTLSW